MYVKRKTLANRVYCECQIECILLHLNATINRKINEDFQEFRLRTCTDKKLLLTVIYLYFCYNCL